MKSPYQKDLFKVTGLIKLRGYLCLAEFNICPEGITGKCPGCGNTEFKEAPYGWIECCHCDFAFDKNILKKI